MKINVDYFKLHALKDKLNQNVDVQLSSEEVTILKQLFEVTEGDYFPNKEELEAQKIRVQALEKLPYEDSRWKTLMADCNEFENKYC